jgi:hypothetical protein
MITEKWAIRHESAPAGNGCKRFDHARSFVAYSFCGLIFDIAIILLLSLSWKNFLPPGGNSKLIVKT